MSSESITADAIPSDSEPSFDLRALFLRFVRRLPIFLPVAALVFGLVAAYTLTRTPVYTADARLLIQPQQTDLLKDADDEAPTESSAVDTEVQVLSSRALAERVVRARGLARDPEFNARLRSEPEAFSLANIIDAVRPQNGGDATTGADQMIADVTDAVHSRVNARRSGLSYVIDVSFTSTDPQKAAELANAFAQEYLLAQTEAKYSNVNGTNRWLNGRLAALLREVQTSDAALQRYKIANNLMSAQGATMAEQEVSTLNQQIAVARAEVAEKQARLNAARRQISRGGGGGDVAAALDSEVVKALRTQRAEVSRRQAELETRYGPLHPDVRKVQRELGDIDQQIQEEIGRITSNLEAQVQVAEQRASSLEDSRGRAQTSLGANNQALVGLNELERRAEASRAVYEAFLNRSKESSAQQGLQRPDARIVSAAETPSAPSAPKKKVNLALGLLLALGAGTGAVFMAEHLDGGLRTAADIERKLRVPSLGAIPVLKRTRRVPKTAYVLERPFSSFAEAFRSLRTSLNFSGDGRPIRIVTLCSALPGEGKTLTTTSFGRSAAQGGAKVLIIDADLRRRSLTSAFGAAPAAGLIEVLEGKLDLHEAFLDDEPSGAKLLLLSNRPAPTLDLLSGPAMDALFGRLREEFDLVLIDTPPVLAVAESRALAARADATVFLVAWSRTPRQAAASALDLLADAGAYVAGVCLTQVDLSQQARLGYGDKLYYYEAYRKYYAD